LEKQVNALLSIQLPKSDNWTSTDNPKIIVNVNLLGQNLLRKQNGDETEFLKKAAGRLAQSGFKRIGGIGPWCCAPTREVEK